MSDPVGGAGSTPSAGSGGAVDSADPVDPAAQVSPGYSADNSQSNSDDGDSGGGSGVGLDTPARVTVSSSDYFRQSFGARLGGFSSVISDFNSRFLTRGGNAIDIETLLSDTQTLLLVFRGFVKDIQSLNKAQTIGLAADAHAAAAGRSLEIPQLKKDIEDFEGSLAAWWIGDDKDPVFFKDILREKEASESRLHTVNTLMALVQTAARDARVALDSVQIQNNSANLETGEESLLKRRLENLIELHGARLQGRKQGRSTDELREFNKKTVEEYDAAIERTQPGVVAEALRALLTPALLASLSALFALDGAAAAIASDEYDGDRPTDQQLADTAEGLALILLAEPVATGSEEEPVDQPYLGDSLSLEGANNPQAFALLLLQQKMSELQASAKMDYARLAEARDATVDNPATLAAAEVPPEGNPGELAAKDAAKDNSLAAKANDIVEDKLLARMLEEQRIVDAMVADSLKDAELASAAIRRHPV